MEILFYMVSAVFGLAVGSFLNVIIDRLPRKKSLVFPPSHCEACGQKLSLFDLIPVLSYLILRGRCRYCRAHIPLRVLFVEISGGIIFILSYWQFIVIPGDASYTLFAYTVFWSCIFLVIIFIDWEHQLILNKITYPMAVVAIIILGIDSFVPGVNLFPGRTFIPEISLFSGLISGGVLLVFFLLIVIIRPGAMGMGDIKLVTLMGLVSGFPLVVFSFVIGAVLGGVVAVYLLASGKKGRKDKVPYGAFLGIGPIIALIFEHNIISWYLG